MKPCYWQGKQQIVLLLTFLVWALKSKEMPEVLSKRSCRLPLNKILQTISFTANGSKTKAIDATALNCSTIIVWVSC